MKEAVFTSLLDFSGCACRWCLQPTICVTNLVSTCHLKARRDGLGLLNENVIKLWAEGQRNEEVAGLLETAVGAPLNRSAGLTATRVTRLFVQQGGRNLAPVRQGHSVSDETEGDRCRVRMMHDRRFRSLINRTGTERAASPTGTDAPRPMHH